MGHPVQNDGTIFFNQHFVQSGILAIRRWIMMKQKHIVRNRHQKEESGPRSQLLIAMHAQQNDYCIVGYLSGGNWHWSDGSNKSYENWSPNEPNNTLWYVQFRSLTFFLS